MLRRAVMSLFKGTAAAASGGGSKRMCADGEDGGHGSTGAWGLGRAELDDLTVRMAQVLSQHDVQLREQRACLLRRVVLPVTGRYGKRFVDVDTAWKRERDREGDRRKGGAMGSKHTRLAAALLEEAYGDEGLGTDGRAKLERGFKDIDLKTEELNTRVQIMKWRTLQGNKEGILEFRLSDEVREVEGELMKLMIANGGKEKTGTEPRGPGIRRVDDLIEGTWKRVSK